MGLIVLPHSLTDGTDAYGSHVKANDDAIVTVVNGGIDDTNIKTGANINGSKILDGSLTGAKLSNLTVTGAKIASGTITGDKIQADQITAVKLTDDDTLGEGVNASELYTGSGQDGAGGYPPTNVLVNRQQHGGKTVWAYFNGSVGSDYLIDDSIDWRYRLIQFIITTTPKGVGEAKKTIPGGATDDSINKAAWYDTGGTASLLNAYYNQFLFFSQAGSDGTVAPRMFWETHVEAGLPDDEGYLWADSATGALYWKVTSISASATTIDCLLKISCSPYLGT